MSEDKIAIVTLLSKDHLDNKQYNVHIDVVFSKHAQTIVKERLKEGYVNDTLCMHNTGVSPPILVKFDKDKPFQVFFDINGCLQPIVPLKEGQNRLKFDGSKADCRRTISFKPVPSEELVADIHFYGKDKEFLHQVLINVPRDSVPTPDAKAPEVSNDSTLSNPPVEDSGCVDGRKSLSESKPITSVVEKHDDESIPIDDDESIPIGKLSLSESIRKTSFDEQRCTGLLAEPSLLNLAKALGPQDASNLIIHLGVPSHTHETNKTNHPGNIVGATLASLMYWYQNTDGSNELKFKTLISDLVSIGRNDLRSKATGCHDSSAKKLEF